jgi:hypothetical protein
VSTLDPKAVRSIARDRPELAALLFVVALFLAFESVVGWKLVDAMDRSTRAVEALTFTVQTLIAR